MGDGLEGKVGRNEDILLQIITDVNEIKALDNEKILYYLKGKYPGQNEETFYAVINKVKAKKQTLTLQNKLTSSNLREQNSQPLIEGSAEQDLGARTISFLPGGKVIQHKREGFLDTSDPNFSFDKIKGSKIKPTKMYGGAGRNDGIGKRIGYGLFGGIISGSIATLVLPVLYKECLHGRMNGDAKAVSGLVVGGLVFVAALLGYYTDYIKAFKQGAEGN